MGLVGINATWIGHKSRYWQYFDNTTKLSVFMKSAIAIYFYSVLVKDQILEDATKKLKAFQLTRTFMYHLLNLVHCVKKDQKTFESIHQCMTFLVVLKHTWKLNFMSIWKNLVTLTVKFYGWLVKVISSNFFFLLSGILKGKFTFWFLAISWNL